MHFHKLKHASETPLAAYCLNVLLLVLNSYREVFLVLSLVHFALNKSYIDISTVCV